MVGEVGEVGEVARLGVVWCPNWPVVVADAQPDEPVIVLHANRVVALSRAAAEHGITSGMRRRQAQSRCPSARLVPWDPDRDGRAFERIAQAIGQMVPRLEITEPGHLGFAARGPARYFGGEVAMAARIMELATAAAGRSLAAVGGFGVGIGDGRFAAGIAARDAATTGRAVVLEPGLAPTRSFLAQRSVELLTLVGGVSGDLVEVFRRLGLQRLGQVAALDEADVLARFAGEGRFAHRLAAGIDDRAPDVRDPPVGLAVQHVFDEPVHHSDIVVFTARRVAESLIDAVAAGGQVCTRVEVTIETEHAERSQRLWYRPIGFTAAGVVERVRWQLEGWAAEQALTAGVALVRIDPVEVRADTGVQQGMWGGRTQADEWATRAVARLVALAGDQQVLVPAAGSGRLVHDLITWVPAATADLFDSVHRLAGVGTGTHHGQRQGPWPGRITGPAPTVVHHPPRPLEVVDAAGAAVVVGGRGSVSAAPGAVVMEGTRRAVTHWAGPWPVEERWWDTTRTRRLARFQLLLDGGRLLEVAVEGQRWWLLGEHA